jgi:HSP20 family protein
MTTTLTPARPRNILPKEVEELFNKFWNEAPAEWVPGAIAAPLDLAETSDAFELRIDAPGMKTSDFDVQVHGNIVTVSGSRKEEKEEKGKTFYRLERRTGSFSRSLTLPCNIDEAGVDANYEAGVLTVKLPKVAGQRPKRIEVKG